MNTKLQYFDSQIQIKKVHIRHDYGVASWDFAHDVILKFKCIPLDELPSRLRRWADQMEKQISKDQAQ